MNATHLHLATPSTWLTRWAHLLAPGSTVLDIACGGGRHMAWLAARGHRCTGIDRDPAALDQAAAAGTTLKADIESGPWPLPPQTRFDLVLVTNYLWRPLLPQIRQSVAEGGLLVYETFGQRQAAIGKPSRSDFLLQDGELLQVCAGWRVLAYEDGFCTEPDRFVQRIVAQRPPSHRPAQALRLVP